MIAATLKGAEKAAALAQLLEDQANLIRCIGQKQLDIQDDTIHNLIHGFLGKVACYIHTIQYNTAVFYTAPSVQSVTILEGTTCEAVGNFNYNSPLSCLSIR